MKKLLEARRACARAIAGCIAVVACSLSGETATAAAAEGEEVEWGYSGATGPDHWGTLSEQFVLCCSGRVQSPINIDQAQPTDQLGPMTITYQATPIKVINNGHTIEVAYAPGSTLTFAGVTYELVQFHFHNPSEHTFTGEATALEAHLVHHDGNGHLAVIGVFLTVGAENPFLAQFWEHLPADIGSLTVPGAINVHDLLPADLSYYTYEGSLTTPPCSEGVRWLLLREVVPMSAEQVATFQARYSGNARPTQPLNERVLFSS